MTALHALRLAAAEQPEGDLKRLLTWAELHIGDQYERICELEDELRQADTENQRRANALNAIRAAMEQQRDKLLAALTEIADLDILKYHHAYAIAKGAIEEIEALK